MMLGLRDVTGQRFFPIQERRALIGSSGRCQIVLDSESVSKEHARIRVGNVGLELDDLGTQNGTFVNGFRIKKHFLCPRDVIRFGDVILEVVLSNEAGKRMELCRRCGVQVDPLQTRRFSRAILEAASKGTTLCPKCEQRAPSRRVPALKMVESTTDTRTPSRTGSRSGSRPGPGTPPPQSDDDGFQLLGYELLEVIGEGNQGIVYKMRHPETGLVAVKRLASQRGRKAKVRFKREANALEQLQHPNLVRLVETREVDGALVIVMEYVDGPSLLEIIQQSGPLTAARGLKIAHEISKGLAYAGQKGIVNRDIKPSNVLVGPNDHAKLTDFGLVSFQNDMGTRLTVEGTWLGTPHYMAPEQVEGKQVDTATDVYGFGATFYEALTGKLPFPAKTPGQLFKLILLEPIDVEPIRAKAGDEVAKIFEKLMAKKPGDRPKPEHLPDLIAGVMQIG